MSWFKRSKDNRTAEQKADNALVNAKNRQIAALTKMCNEQSAMIEDFASSMRKSKKASTEDKIVDTIIGLFTDQPKQAEVVEVQSTLETGAQFSDAEITEKISKVPKPILNNLINAGRDQFVQSVKSNVSGISDESANRAYELAVAQQ